MLFIRCFHIKFVAIDNFGAFFSCRLQRVVRKFSLVERTKQAMADKEENWTYQKFGTFNPIQSNRIVSYRIESNKWIPWKQNVIEKFMKMIEFRSLTILYMLNESVCVCHISYGKRFCISIEWYRSNFTPTSHFHASHIRSLSRFAWKFYFRRNNNNTYDNTMSTTTAAAATTPLNIY